MATNSNYFQTTSIFCLLMIWSNFSLAEDRHSIAENNALRYMVAFFSIEMDEVIEFTHPDVIDQTTDAFLVEISRVQESGDLDEFLAGFGITPLSSNELMSISKEELYSLIVSSNNRRATKSELKQMKAIKFKVQASKLTNENTTIVTMFMGDPTPNQEIRLELRLHNDKWLIVGNAP